MRSVEWLCCLGWSLTTLNHLNFYILRCLMYLRNWLSQRLHMWCTGWMCKLQLYGRQNAIGAWSGRVTYGSFNHITGTAEPKVIKFCTQVGYINSSNRMPYHTHMERGYGHATVLKFCRLPWCSSSRVFVSDCWAIYLSIKQHQVRAWCRFQRC